MTDPLPQRLPQEALAELCRKWKIARLEAFGSVLREDFSPESDFDFLYTWAPDARWGLQYVHMKADFEAVLGRRVDLVNRPQIERHWNWPLRRSILAQTELIYAA
ncbi:MAG: nucleotidyltransferase domain-containing protein [bacterium]